MDLKNKIKEILLENNFDISLIPFNEELNIWHDPNFNEITIIYKKNDICIRFFYIKFGINGPSSTITYFKNNNYHRENGPALISTEPNFIEEKYYINGKNITELYKNHPDILTNSKLLKILY